MPRDFHYLTNCVNVPRRDVEALHDMIDRAREVTWRTLTRHVPVAEIRDHFPGYEYNGRGLHIKDDWAVSFNKSKYKGKPCYYIRWSAIEYIFCPVNSTN